MSTYFTPLDGSTNLEEIAPKLVAKFEQAGYTVSGLTGHLGPDIMEAMHRGDSGALEFATRAGSTLDQIVHAFILHNPVTSTNLEQLLGAELAGQLIEAQVAVDAKIGGDLLVIALDIRPHIINGTNYWVFADIDASMVAHVPGPSHVLGVGSASLSLLKSTPNSPVSSVLDLGTGSGVQILGQLECAETITATDVHPRALNLAAATVHGAGATGKVELLQGSWFEPVAGRKFDRIVSNPPYVVGLPEVGHVYRDSGLDLDGASELVISSAADYLNPGGTAHILAAWIHQGDTSWQQRVASWLPDYGVRAWIIQRDVADPALYVSTWLKDESVDLRTNPGRQQARSWLEHFETNDVHAIGFGFVALEKIADDLPSEVLAEELTHSLIDPLGAEIEEYFARCQWLTDLVPGQLESKQLSPRPGLAKEVISISRPICDAQAGQEQAYAGESTTGFQPAALRLTRTEGPRWSHDVDEHLAAIVSGLNPNGLNLEETVSLYAAAHGFDEEELLRSAVPAISDLIRHGLVIPAELLDAQATHDHGCNPDAGNLP